jgi:hypothetical protein
MLLDRRWVGGWVGVDWQGDLHLTLNVYDPQPFQDTTLNMEDTFPKTQRNFKVITMLGCKDPIQSLNRLSSAISTHNGQWQDRKRTTRDFKMQVKSYCRVSTSTARYTARFQNPV